MKSVQQNMRPCVQWALDKGAIDKDHRKKMTFAIIYEMTRIGVDKADIKLALLDWNQRCFEVMSPGDAKRQLCDYVDWFMKLKEKHLSCKSLREFTDQCDACGWQPIRKKTFLPYTIGQAQDFLEKAFSKYAQGYTMGRVLAVLLALRDEKGFDKLCVGLRSIRSRLIDGYSINLDPKDLSRALYRLEEVGFLRITKGQAGEFAFRRSNEYTFLRWTPEQVTAPDPQQQTAPPIISHMCGSSQTLCVAP